MTFRSTKTFGHDLGLSACFRQWRATHSHCSRLHGYALSFRFEFEAALDDRNWVVDFGNLDGLKERLKADFDHKMAVAGDDPNLNDFLDMHNKRIAQVKVFPGGVGCELFAEHAYHLAVEEIDRLGLGKRVHVVSCECAEHGANSAIFIG